MKCIKCRTNNVHNANYCKKCAYKFSEEEQKAAEKWTFVGFLKFFEKVKKYVTFDFITGETWFKVGSIIVVLGIGICFAITNGFYLKIEESENYNGNYNRELNEHYLYSEKEETELNLYVPDRAIKLIVKHYDKGDKLLKEEEHDVTDNIVLDSNSDEDYYILEAQYEKNNFDRLKLFIYQTEDGE